MHAIAFPRLNRESLQISRKIEHSKIRRGFAPVDHSTRDQSDDK